MKETLREESIVHTSRGESGGSSQGVDEGLDAVDNITLDRRKSRHLRDESVRTVADKIESNVFGIDNPRSIHKAGSQCGKCE